MISTLRYYAPSNESYEFQSLIGILVDFNIANFGSVAFNTLFQSLIGILVDFNVSRSVAVLLDLFQSLIGILVDFNAKISLTSPALSEPVSIPDRDFS